MVDMILPAMDMIMPLPGTLMMDMLLPATDIDMTLPGPLMVVMLLPVMDMDMPLPGLLMVDMLLPATDIEMLQGPRIWLPQPATNKEGVVGCQSHSTFKGVADGQGGTCALPPTTAACFRCWP